MSKNNKTSDTPETAETMARRQREISVSEFFLKNRHLLGFDNPRKALLTAVKEAVDNSLDACEEAGILPEISVEIRQLASDRFRIDVTDNGPGIVRAQIPRIFAKLLYGSKGARTERGAVDASSEIPEEDYVVPLGKAQVRREGTDVTVLATLLMMHRSLQAAESLHQEGISAEVIDPRSLVPFDWETVKASVAKTGRVVIVEESPKRGGIGAEIAATLAEEMIEYLTAPVKRVAAPNTPAPFAPPMEKFYVPSVERIAQGIREVRSF